MDNRYRKEKKPWKQEKFKLLLGKPIKFGISSVLWQAQTESFRTVRSIQEKFVSGRGQDREELQR